MSVKLVCSGGNEALNYVLRWTLLRRCNVLEDALFVLMYCVNKTEKTSFIGDITLVLQTHCVISTLKGHKHIVLVGNTDLFPFSRL